MPWAPAGGPVTPPEPADRVAYEPATLGCLGAALVLGGWALGWAVWQGVKVVKSLLGL
jgi:hypothetical protein